MSNTTRTPAPFGANRRNVSSSFTLYKRVNPLSHSLHDLGSQRLSSAEFLVEGACLLLSVTIMVWLIFGIFNRISNLFNNIPGPRVAKLTNLWKLYHLRKRNYLKKVQDLHRKHGVVVQVGPYEYSVSDPTALYWRLEKVRVTNLYVLIFFMCYFC